MEFQPNFVQPRGHAGGKDTKRQVFSRVWLKIALLGGQMHWPGIDSVVLSQCDECDGLAPRLVACERSLRLVEEKLDLLLELQRRKQAPAWAEQSEQRVISALRKITAEVGFLASRDAELTSEANRLRDELGDLADGADRFLAGLQSKLSERDKILFFELIASVDDPKGRRVKTYAEIGERLHVTRQAIEKRYKRLRGDLPNLGDYVEAIRKPRKPKNFSEMSCSDRRKKGIDEAYNYHAN